MISTKSALTTQSGVPNAWVFEYYCKLGERLTGQIVNLKSLLNPEDSNPSMYILVGKRGEYIFKDYSADKAGDGWVFVKCLLEKQYGREVQYKEALEKMQADYRQFRENNRDEYLEGEYSVQVPYRVSDYATREWNLTDAKYWRRYLIGSSTLEQFNVRPLSYYRMSRQDESGLKEFYISGERIYGYFRSDGSLYKIYKPDSQENKFVKIADYIQGTDQLTYKKDYLVIASSLKDGMCLHGFGYKNIEFVAPDSENTLIRKETISIYKENYKGIFTLFDNDSAGMKAMAKYRNYYNVNGVLLPMCKDLSDSVEAHGRSSVRSVLEPLMRKSLKQ